MTEYTDRGGKLSDEKRAQMMLCGLKGKWEPLDTLLTGKTYNEVLSHLIRKAEEEPADMVLNVSTVEVRLLICQKECGSGSRRRKH